MISVWMAYAAVAAASSAIFALAGWRGRRTIGLHRGDVRPAEFASSAMSQDGLVLNAIRVALKRVAPVISHYDTRIDVAVLSGLTVPIPDTVLIDVIEDMLTVAVRSAPACRLLLTAVAQGDDVEIMVTDDLPNADQAFRLGQVRGLHERVAALGGTLHVTVHPTEGTAIAVQLTALPALQTSGAVPYGLTRSRGAVGAAG